MNIEKLILCVESRRPLWDQKCKEYHNRIIVKKLWEEVAKEVGETSLMVKGKWRNLRDNFRRELLKLENSRSGDAGGSSKKPKWAYFEILLFLRDTLTSRPSSGNVTVPEDNQEINNYSDEGSNNIQQETQNDTDEGSEKNDEINANNAFRTPASNKIINEHRIKLQKNNSKKETIQEQLLRIEQKKLETFSAISANSNDSNYHFLMSLLPLMRQLNPLKNMQMRLNIQQLFVNEQMSMQPGYGQYPNTSPQTVYTPQISPCETYTSGSTESSQVEECPLETNTGILSYTSSANHMEENAAKFFHVFT